MYRVLQGSLFPSPVLRAKHFDRLTPEARTEALKKWRGAGQLGQAAPERAVHAAARPEGGSACGPSAVFAMTPTACSIEQGNLFVLETALDSDCSETKT